MKEYRHLTLMERAEIARMNAHGYSRRKIGEAIRRDPGTISREIRRNQNGRGMYYAGRAQREAMRRREIARKPLRMADEALRDEIEALIREDWSAEQIAGWRKRHGKKSVSRTTIYRHAQSRESLRAHFRGWGRPAPQRATPYRRIYHQVMIDQRPEAAHQRLEPGHWECDSMRGPMKTSVGLATLVDRRTRYLRMGRVGNRSARSWNQTARQLLDGWIVKSLTADHGMEFGSHRELAKMVGAPVYFAHARCPWERGTNENHNRLIRQYVPKDMDPAELEEEEIRWIEDRINTRPRKSLGYYSPAERAAAENFCPPRGGQGERI
jgi:IS30 family transposase